jgi:dCTP deaminase
MARLGIESHISAGFGDIGFVGNWTLEITVVHPIKIYPGMRIGQVYFHEVSQKHNLPQYRYKGKYKHQITGPQESLAYLD